MKLKLIEKEKKGFARYCPTFAKAYECMKEGLVRRTKTRRIRNLTYKFLNGDAKVRNEAARALLHAPNKGTGIIAPIPALVRMLGDGDEYVRICAASALADAASERKDMTAAIPELVKAFGDTYQNVGEFSARALAQAAAAGKSRVAALDALVKALGDEEGRVLHYDSWASGALNEAAGMGADMTPAIPALAKALGGRNLLAWENAAGALEKAANQTDRKMRTLIMNGLIGFVHSDWFQNEMEWNSVIYERTAAGIARLLNKIKEAEEKEAA